jgi:hypothetical protein
LRDAIAKLQEKVERLEYNIDGYKGKMGED